MRISSKCNCFFTLTLASPSLYFRSRTVMGGTAHGPGHWISWVLGFLRRPSRAPWIQLCMLQVGDIRTLGHSVQKHFYNDITTTIFDNVFPRMKNERGGSYFSFQGKRQQHILGCSIPTYSWDPAVPRHGHVPLFPYSPIQLTLRSDQIGSDLV